VRGCGQPGARLADFISTPGGFLKELEIMSKNLRTASEFLRQRAGTANPKNLVKFLRRAPKAAPIKGDERA
jgi:hypothetical protein